jgi:hypothetical protein
MPAHVDFLDDVMSVIALRIFFWMTSQPKPVTHTQTSTLTRGKNLPVTNFFKSVKFGHQTTESRETSIFVLVE